MLATQKNNEINQQVKKLVTRIKDLSENKTKFFEFLIKCQQMFAQNSKSIKNQIESFEETITKKSFYSYGKCKNMKKFIIIYKHLCTFIEDVAKLKILELKKIDIDSTKQQQKLSRKTDSFIKAVSDYSQSENEYNKKYSQYEYICEKLNSMMVKSKTFEDPINFYNLNIAADFSKNLQKRYHDSQNKQVSLISNIQVLDQKRKRLSENLVDIKQEYLFLLHTHMVNILNAATVLTDTGKDDLYNMQSIMAIQGQQGDLFKNQIQRFDIKYGRSSDREDELFSDLKQLFNSNSQQVQISSDLKLFLDRCQNFIQKKSESVEQFLYLQKKLLDFIQDQMAFCQKIDKQFQNNQKYVFKSNGTQDFKKKVTKYFGSGTLNIVTLCFLINQMPKRRLDKVNKLFQSHIQKMKKILQKKQQQLKKFKKRISQILSQYNNQSKNVQNNLFSVSQLKSNIQKTFNLFKNIYDQFVRNQSVMDLDFEQVFKNIITFIKRQSEHCLLKYNLKKQKEKLLYDNVFKKFNTDTEIIQIVKQDTRYQILFNQPLKPNLYDQFKSLIQKQKYQQTKKILQKKEVQSRGIVSEGQPGCCGINSGRVMKYSKIKSFKANLLGQDQRLRPGKLEILNKGLLFDQRKKNLFAEKIQLIIPTKQVLSFSHKYLNQNQNGVQIMTNMGPIVFLSEQYHELQQNLQKHLGTKLAARDQNNSKLEKSGDNSSFMKQNNTSTEYKVSFQKSVISPQTKGNINKWNKNTNTDAMLLKKVIQSWKKQKLLSDFFTINSSHPPSSSTGSIRTDYKFQNDINKFLLKQKKTLSIQKPNQNLISFLYEWKISFPDMPMLKSFTHGEQVKIQLTPNSVKVRVIQRNRGEAHLFVRKTFYTEIDKMNRKLSDIVVEICQRQGQVIIDQQPQSSQSQILLDLENFGMDKQQQSRHDKIVKRYSNSNAQIDSFKGGNSKWSEG